MEPVKCISKSPWFEYSSCWAIHRPTRRPIYISGVCHSECARNYVDEELKRLDELHKELGTTAKKEGDCD